MKIVSAHLAAGQKHGQCQSFWYCHRSAAPANQRQNSPARLLW